MINSSNSMINNEPFLITIELIPNLVIVTSGTTILLSNESFLDFFNYKDLSEFNKYNDNISDLFSQYEDYFSLDIVDENILWTDYLYQNSKHAVVSMIDNHCNPAVFEVAINLLPDYNNCYIISFTNITAIQNEKKLLERMAYRDPLTNIYNRQMFNKMLRREKENMKRHHDSLSLIMFDIDHFKKVNDTYGHDIGDKVLVTLTKLITKNLRQNDLFARWGGEEFMILLPRADANIAYNIAQKLRQIIEQYKDNIIPSFTVSFGVTEILGIDKEQSCFIRVDKALYSAKINRNDVVRL